MSRFRKLSHTLWHCQYHIVWVPKYRYRVLDGPIRDAAYKGIHLEMSFRNRKRIFRVNIDSRAGDTILKRLLTGCLYYFSWTRIT